MDPIIAATLSALVAALIVHLLARSKVAALAERVRARDAENARLTNEVTALREQASQLQQAKSDLSARLEAERAAREHLTTEFKALSADAMRANRNDFLEQATQVFAHLQQQTVGELEHRKQAVEALVQPLKESLAQFDAKIMELEKARASTYGALGEQLKALSSAQLQLQAEASRLSTALRSTTYAGSWGELQLRRVVEMADMLSYCDFAEQQSAGGLRADLVIRLPGGQRIVVDAKAPLESYRAACNETNDELRAARLFEHAQKVRGHIDALGAKNYWEHFQPAPEFVVLFLPGDQLLSAALQSDPLLLDRAISRRVLLATPTTLIALLKAAAHGWRHEAVSRNADEISLLGRTLYDRVAAFADNFDRVGRGLEALVKLYNTAAGSFEGSLLPGARRLAELGARGKKELPQPVVVTTAAREIVRKN